MMRRWTGIALVGAALGVAGGGGPARADEPRVLVLPFSGSVPDAPDGTARLTQVVARAAGLTGATVVIGQATFSDAAALAGCSDETPQCFEQLAESLRVDEVVIGEVTPAHDRRSVTITLKHFQGGRIDEKSLTVPAGSMDELVKRVAREVPRLLVSGGEPSEPAADPVPNIAPAQQADRPLPEPAQADRGRRGRIGVLPWVVMGTGVALAGAGGAFLYMAKKKQDAVDAAPIQDADDFDRLVALEDKGDRYTNVGRGLMIGGGVILAGGVAWALVKRATGSERGSEPTMALEAAPLDGGVGFAISRTW
ncbi:MAG TPA: hypothetical protein VIG06_22665 [Kofleriaceae bacterium]|jgi:hypothetical protein